MGQLKYKNTAITVGDGQVGPLAYNFFYIIQDIQHSAIEGLADWVEVI